jgi:HEPN domain-containing protein
MATPIDLARRLLGAAKDDELAARSILPIEGIADTIVGFHAQQATEKAIKAVLAAEGVKFPFIHDLESLIELCKNSEIDVPSMLDGARALTPFAAAERYGSVVPIGLDRDQALEWAGTAIAWARPLVEKCDPGQPPTTSS